MTTREMIMLKKTMNQARMKHNDNHKPEHHKSNGNKLKVENIFYRASLRSVGLEIATQ